MSDPRPWTERMGMREDSNEEWDTDRSEEESGSDAADDEMACPALVAVDEVRWDDWEERVEEDRRTRPQSRCSCSIDSRVVRTLTNTLIHIGPWQRQTDQVFGSVHADDMSSAER